MRTVVLVEGIKVGLMLEVVGVYIAAFGCIVRNDIVVHDLDFKRIAFGFERFNALFENFSVRRRACRYFNNLVVFFAAAGSEYRCREKRCADECKYLFHDFLLLCVKISGLYTVTCCGYACRRPWQDSSTLLAGSEQE